MMKHDSSKDCRIKFNKTFGKTLLLKLRETVRLLSLALYFIKKYLQKMHNLNVFFKCILKFSKVEESTIFYFITFKDQLSLLKTSDVYSNYVHFGAHFYQAEDFFNGKFMHLCTFIHEKKGGDP